MSSEDCDILHPCELLGSPPIDLSDDINVSLESQLVTRLRLLTFALVFSWMI